MVRDRILYLLTPNTNNRNTNNSSHFWNSDILNGFNFKKIHRRMTELEKDIYIEELQKDLIEKEKLLFAMEEILTDMLKNNNVVRISDLPVHNN